MTEVMAYWHVHYQSVGGLWEQDCVFKSHSRYTALLRALAASDDVSAPSIEIYSKVFASLGPSAHMKTR